MGRQVKKRQSSNQGTKYALIADGETEQWYIQQLKQYYNIPIKITPELPKTKTLKEQNKLIESIIKENIYDKIIWIIDLDTVLKDNKDSKNPGKALSDFKTIYNNVLTKWQDQVTIIVNNPCLEFWYCMHMNPNINTFFENYDKMLPTLKKYNIDKQLFAKYNKNKTHDYQAGQGLFRKTLPDLQKMFLSKTNPLTKDVDFSKFKPFNPGKCESEGCSEMWKLFELLGIRP